MNEKAFLEEIERRFSRMEEFIRRRFFQLSAAVGAALLGFAAVALFFVDSCPGWRPRQAVVAGMSFGACMGYTGMNPRLRVIADGEGIDIPVANWEFRRDFGQVVTILVHPDGVREGVSLQRPIGDWYYRTMLWAMWSPEKVKSRKG